MVKLNLDFTPNLKKLEDLTKKPWLSSWLAGSYSSLFKGSGMEFESYNIYTPDQDSRKIDWKASARSDKVLMRTYLEERNLNCNVIMDCSNSMFFSSTNKLKCEYAAEIANSLCFAIIASDDQAGLVMSSENIYKIIPSNSGHSHYFSIMNELSKESNYGGRRNLKYALNNLFRSKDKGILFIISDFLNIEHDEMEMISLLKQKYEIFCFMVRDRVEKYLPSDLNAVCIEDMNTGRDIIVNLKQVRTEYHDIMVADEKKIESFFLRHDVRLCKFYTHVPFEKLLIGFFESQKKR